MSPRRTMTPELDGFAGRLRDCRKSAGISQRELARRLGDYVHLGLPVKPSGPYISLLEAGKRRPSLETVYALADALEVEREWLLNGVNRRRSR